MTDHRPRPGVTLHQSLLKAPAARHLLRAASVENVELAGQNQLKIYHMANTKLKYLYGEDVVHAYPDGWSCISCGTDFDEDTINVECLYVIQTKEGVECLKCVNEDDV